MKILLLSVSIAILGYFALQALPDRRDAPRFASASSDATADGTADATSDASTYSRNVPRVRGRH